jgi:hypothetical protein
MESTIKYLKTFKNKRDLYIIEPKNVDLLKNICLKLNYKLTSEIAYIGKADLTITSDLFK